MFQDNDDFASEFEHVFRSSVESNIDAGGHFKNKVGEHSQRAALHET